MHTESNGSLFAVRFEPERRRVRLTVEDLGGDEEPRIKLFAGSYNGDLVGGHGLALVEALSDDWGVDGDELGREVWAVWQ